MATGKTGTSLATKTYVKRCMRMAIEVKSIPVQNIVGNGGVPTTAGRVDPLQSFNIIQGNTDQNRDGNFVKPKKLTVRMFISLAADNVAPALVRVILFQDKQTNGANPAVTDVITSGTGGVAAGYNPDNVIGSGGHRFRILSDKFMCINPDAVVDAANTLGRYQCWTTVIGGKRLSPIRYDATAGVITDIVSGEINVLTMSDNNTVLVNGSTQMLFTDS